MEIVRNMALWRQLRSPGTALLLVALGFTLVRSDTQPALVVHVGTSASIVPGDVAAAALALGAAWALVRHGVPRQAWPVLASGVVFCLLVLLTAAVNGAASFVAGAKMVELAALALGAIAFVRTRATLEAVVDVLLIATVTADIWGGIEFLRAGGGRQAAFLGEHELAALGTLPLVYGLVLAESRRRNARAVLTIVAGGLACILGASLATLLGLWLAAAVFLGAMLLRRSLTRRTLAVTVLAVGLVTAGTAEIRSGAFGFLQVLAGKQESRPSEFAGSWSQRLIYTYVDGRVFLAHPVLGTGWYSLLPPREWTMYLPDTKRRFHDEPANYFPHPDQPLVPQQAYDQVLSQLGGVGFAVFVAMLGSVALASWRAARRTPGLVGDIPAAWFAGGLGAIAGEAFFGGSPLTALWWLAVGAAPALATISAAHEPE